MNTERILRIKRVFVQGLFGLYNHDVHFFNADRVTILHGPNGVGKTLLLRMLLNIFEARFAALISTPFDSILVAFDDDTELTLTRIVTPSEEPGAPAQTTLTATLTDGSGPKTFQLGTPVRFAATAERIARERPYLVQAGPDHWQDSRSGQVLSSREVTQKFGRNHPSVMRAQVRFKEPDELKAFRMRIRLHVIETQRLLKMQQPEVERDYDFDQTPQLIATVREYSDDLRQRIAEGLTDYAGKSQALDQTFPTRLITEQSAQLSTAELRDKLEALELQRKNLSDMGLLDSVSTDPVERSDLDTLSDAKKGVMTLYVQDTSQKLGVLNSLANRIQLLLQSVNSKFRNKQIRISREKGITVIGKGGNDVAVDALSSGEQHEIVLLYDLLFRVKPNTLVLIDEPELSLHVTWQKKFLPELLQIVKTVGFDALVATHSPFIVGDRLDLLVPLDAEADQ